MEILIRATVIYWFLWLVFRGTGKRSLAQLTALDLLIVVVLGDIIQQGVTEEDMSLVGAAAAVSVFVLWTLVSDRLARSSRRLSTILNSDPVILVRDGVPSEQRMRRERLTIDDLREAAREKGIGSLGDVAICVLETDGSFSFISRESA